MIISALYSVPSSAAVQTLHVADVALAPQKYKADVHPRETFY